MEKKILKDEEVGSIYTGKNDFMCSILTIGNENLVYFKQLFKDLHEKASDRAEVFWEVAQNNIIKLASKDPTPIHQISVRLFLKEKELEAVSSLVDNFSRCLATACQNLEKEIRKIGLMHLSSENESVRSEIGHNFDLYISKTPSKDVDFLLQEKDGMLWVDAVFLDFLSTLGKEGKKAKKDLIPVCQKRYSKFIEGGKRDMPLAFKAWVSKDDPFFPGFLNILTKIVWFDRVKPAWEREQGKHPSLTRAVCHEVILPTLAAKTTIKKDTKNNKISTYNQSGQEIMVVANIDMTYFDSSFIGIKNFNSITGHKLLRWQVDTGFNNWKKNLTKKGGDPRVVIIEGGYGTLCEMIGCPNRSQYRKTLKSILHAQAYGHFKLPDGSQGNLISLRELEFHRNGEASKIEIIIGGALMPNYANILKNPEDRRLIPITKLPKLVLDPSSHASQATLQLNFLKEVSDRSPEFAENKAIIITPKRWEELSKESGLNPDKVKNVIEAWCEYDFDNQFLDKSGDQFTIADPFAEARNFLLEQGRYRLKKSKEGQQRRKQGEAKKKKG